MPKPQRARRARKAGPAFDPLEPRALMTVATPTDYEQYMLELINRARANPAAEAQRLVSLAQTDPLLKVATQGWDLGVFAQKLSSYAPEPPLAFDPRLIEAARLQDAAMLAINGQFHSAPGFLTDPSVAVASDGQAYEDVAGADWATGENVFAFSDNVLSSNTTDYVNYQYAAFMIDWGNTDFGHLANIMAPGPAEYGPGSGHYPASEVGVGLLTGVAPASPPDPNPPDPRTLGLNVGPDLVAEEFAWKSTELTDLTGVVYADNDRNGFYTPGEGLGGVTIRAVGQDGQGTFQVQTWSSGGYTLPLPPGKYAVTASGGGLTGIRTEAVAIGRDNAGWDLPVTPTPADLPVPADYDGDGKADLASYNTQTGVWTIRDSSTGQVAQLAFGQPGDVPVPGRYDGGSKALIAVYRPTTAQWIVDSPTGVRVYQFGWAGHDIPVPGDYDGDGVTDLAVYRPSTAQWFVHDSSTGRTRVTAFGWAGVDQPIPADYDGAGRTDIAVFRPGTSDWFILHNNGQTTDTPFGWDGHDVPVPRDYGGDGKADIAVYRPDTGDWFVRSSSTGTTTDTSFGWAGVDQPEPGDYGGGPSAQVAVFRPGTAQWFIRPANGGTAGITVLGTAGNATTGLAALGRALAVPTPWYAWATPPPAAKTESGSSRPLRRPAVGATPTGPMALSPIRTSPISVGGASA